MAPPCHRPLFVRSFVRSLARSLAHSSRKFFVDAKISVTRKFVLKKFGPLRSISSKNRRNRSYPRDFWTVWNSKILHAIFWRIRPIVPGFARIWLWFAQIPGRSAGFIKKWHVDFFSADMMIWWYDDIMISWYEDIMIWWYDDMMWWYDDKMM